MSNPGVEIRSADASDVLYMLLHMRNEDWQELRASHGRAAATAVLYHSVKHWEDSYVGLYNGERVALFGVAPRSLIGGGGTPWMVATELLNEHKVAFLKQSRRWVEHMLQKYGYLENYVDERNVASKRWLRWLGFQIERPEAYGVGQLPFHRFHRGEL